MTKAMSAVQRVVDDGRVKQLAEVRLRPAFVVRSDPAPAGSDRKLPERKFRPPSTRLVTSRGSLLRFALLTYFEAQTQLYPGQSHVSNSRPLVGAGGTDIGWIDLLAEDTRDNKAHDEKATYLDAPAKMLDQLKGSVKRLARPENELVALPGGAKSANKFEHFHLLHEGGRRDTGSNVRYVVPLDGEDYFTVPVELFTHGWIHVLEESELALLLVSAYQSSVTGGSFQMTSEERLRRHGLSPSAFDRHQFLSSLGLLEVIPHVMRTSAGKMIGYEKPEPHPSTGEVSKTGLVPHTLNFLAEGFKELALPAACGVLDV
ncbi:hypothetical protein AN948_03740 [Rhodococcus sp. ADH]|uniref:hypothetical protein n=1 Tax=Rhodococcus sp. ADH TaxID=224843 RepID=UPI0006BA4CA9|nr:hypothetical protein [Rhodococcus sp. ADH]KPH21077.1 hypothetical protein AN948_03740 [Rhodococcus sp. ADH]